MKSQRIKVNTKGGLLAAFECAKMYGYFEKSAPDTIITLTRKTGESRYIIYGELQHWAGHKYIRKAQTNVRKIPAKELLA